MSAPTKLLVGYVAFVLVVLLVFASGYKAGHEFGVRDALRPVEGKILAEMSDLRGAMIASARGGGVIWLGPGHHGELTSDVWVGNVKIVQLSTQTVVNVHQKEAP